MEFRVFKHRVPFQWIFLAFWEEQGEVNKMTKQEMLMQILGDGSWHSTTELVEIGSRQRCIGR